MLCILTSFTSKDFMPPILATNNVYSSASDYFAAFFPCGFVSNSDPPLNLSGFMLPLFCPRQLHRGGDAGEVVDVANE
jgi:hypothetical protein